MGRTFQLTDLSLRELEDKGLAGETMAALRRLKHRRFASKQDFLHSMDETNGQPVSEGERRLILKTCRGSLLGLERWVPNRATREWIEALIFALLVAGIVRTFIFAPFKIPSGSMVPTIQIGDHIFATMFSYGVPVPFTDSRLFPSDIARGDVVIFPYPLDPSVDYIKRVIALGGETVEVKGTTVYIDGKALSEPYAYHDPVIVSHLRRNLQQAPGYGPVRVPEGKIFVMGDNRFNSSDSRAWTDQFGVHRPFVDVTTIKGKGRIVYWSHDPEEGWFAGYRFGRIGTLLE